METQERIVNMSELEELEKIVKEAQARIAFASMEKSK